MTVLRVDRPRLIEGRDSTSAITKFLAQFAKREPGRGITGRKLECLHQQIGGSGKIAFGFTIARPFEPAVGDQIS